MKKVLSLILSFAFILSIGTISVSANANNTKDAAREECYLEEFGGTLVRYTEGSAVVVKWIPEAVDSEIVTIVNHDGVISIDNEILYTLVEADVPINHSPALTAATDVSWGTWQTFSERVNTGGVPVVIAAGIIAAAAPWVAVRVIAAAIGGIASSEYYTISGKLRYGSDDDYFYYQRYTSIQTDTGAYIIKDFYDTGKEPL